MGPAEGDHSQHPSPWVFSEEEAELRQWPKPLATGF